MKQQSCGTANLVVPEQNTNVSASLYCGPGRVGEAVRWTDGQREKLYLMLVTAQHQVWSVVRAAHLEGAAMKEGKGFLLDLLWEVPLTAHHH